MQTPFNEHNIYSKKEKRSAYAALIRAAAIIIGYVAIYYAIYYGALWLYAHHR